MGAAAPLLGLAAILIAAGPGGGPQAPLAPSLKAPPPPPRLELLRPERPTPAQRVMPGLH